MEYYASVRKDEYPAFVSAWMGLEEIMLSELVIIWFHLLVEHKEQHEEHWKMGRSELGEIGGGDKPWETVDSEKQTEGFGGEGVGGWVKLLVGIMEDTNCVEHWVWCINNEFWNTEKK